MSEVKDLTNKKSIAVYKTNKNIFEIKDMLNLIGDAEIGRIHSPKQSRIHFFGATLNEEGKQEIKLNHYISPEDLLVIIDAIKTGRFSTQYATKYGLQYVEYKGSPKSDKYGGRPESRVLSIKYQEKIGNDLARFPWTISFQLGEGVLKEEGAIMPKTFGKPDQKVEIKFSNHDFMKLMLKVERYITNWEHYAFRKVIDTQYKK